MSNIRAILPSYGTLFVVNSIIKESHVYHHEDIIRTRRPISASKGCYYIFARAREIKLGIRAQAGLYLQPGGPPAAATATANARRNRLLPEETERKLAPSVSDIRVIAPLSCEILETTLLRHGIRVVIHATRVAGWLALTALMAGYNRGHKAAQPAVWGIWRVYNPGLWRGIATSVSGVGPWSFLRLMDLLPDEQDLYRRDPSGHQLLFHRVYFCQPIPMIKETFTKEFIQYSP